MYRSAQVSGFPIICLLILTLLFFGAAGQPCHPQACTLKSEIEILFEPVQVKAVYEFSGMEWDRRRCRYFGEITTYVSVGDHTYTVSYFPISVYSPDQAVENVVKGIGWKDGYLFVPSSCGSGNAFNCNTEHVFTIREGTLVKIGEFVGSLVHEENGPGRTYRNGNFYDIYAFTGPYLSRAETAIYSIALKDVKGSLIPDFDWTWRHNLEKYTKCFEDIHRHIKQEGVSQDKWRDVLRQLFFCAGLSHYCDKQPQLELIMWKAKALLPPEIFDEFKQTIDTVAP